MWHHRQIGRSANRARKLLKVRKRRFHFESLEPRLTLSANASPFPAPTWSTAANGLPILTSFPTAPAMIYLDYDGDANQGVVETDFDGTPGVFTLYEQQRIAEHWRGVSAVFSMFNIGVTTVKPAAGVPTEWIAITNDMITKGGVNGVNVFPNNLNTGATGKAGSDWWAEGYAHELSHGFGNWHQAAYDLLGNETDQYAVFPMNDPLRAGIMGDGAGTVIKWQYSHGSHNFTTGRPDVRTIQSDMATIAGDLAALAGGGDGYRPDDQTGTKIEEATALTVIDSSTQAKIGIIERLTDQDWWSFSSTGGTYNILVGRDYPSPVDVKVSVFDAAGNLIAYDDGDPIASATAGSSNYRTLVNDTHLSLNLAAGNYFIKVESHGNYSDQGQYIVRVDRMLEAWQSEDIGLTVSPGFTDYDPATQTFTIGGSGRGIGGTTAQGGDQAHFAYTKLTGDGEVIARVASMETATNLIRAGITARESMATGSRSFSITTTPTSGITQTRRATTNANAATASTAAFAFSPVWLRIQRVGDAFTSYYSTNGTTWTQIGSSQTIAMGTEVYVGLISTSGNDLDRLTSNYISTATFTNVSVFSKADIGLTGTAGSHSYDAATGVYTLSGRGAGWGSVASQSDASYIYYRSLAGDGSITVRIANQNIGGAMSGIFVRESLSSNSRYVATWVNPTTGTTLSSRMTAGGVSSETSAESANWLRIVRTGNVFQAFTSIDGVAWTQIGDDQAIAMNSRVMIGMLVASGDTATTNTTTFDDVSFAGGINVAQARNSLPAPVSVAVPTVTSTSATITWAAPNVAIAGDFNQDGVVDAADYVRWRKDGGPQADYDIWRLNFGASLPSISTYSVERSIDNVDFQTIGSTAANVLTFTDNNVTGGQNYYYRVRTGDAVGFSVPSAVATTSSRPQAVTGLKVYSYSINTLVVEWIDTSNETDYTLQRSLDGINGWATIGAATINKNTTIYVDSGLAASTRYFYRVITNDVNDVAATSAVINAYTRIDSAPTNISFASTNNTSITFSWNAMAGITRYAIFRGNGNDNFEWTLLNSNVTTTSFTSSGLTAGADYYYRIVGYDANGAATRATEIMGFPGISTPALPSPWLTQDIGSVNITGAAGFSGGTFTIVGGGADIWGNSDEFRFVYRQMTGNGFIQARVDSMNDPPINFYSRAGVMIRESTAVGSKQVSMMLHETDGGARLQARTGTNAGTGETVGPIVNSPYWVRLERSGNTITGKVSPDGVTWTTVGSYNVSMSSTVLIGMALTPRDDNYGHWAKFDNVTSSVTGAGAELAAGAVAFPAQLTSTPPMASSAASFAKGPHGGGADEHSREQVILDAALAQLDLEDRLSRRGRHELSGLRPTPAANHEFTGEATSGVGSNAVCRALAFTSISDRLF